MTKIPLRGIENDPIVKGGIANDLTILNHSTQRTHEMHFASIYHN